MLIKKGAVSVDTSLKELEENYSRKPEWKVIEEGLSIPVEEFRMMNPPKPDRTGQIEFGKKSEVRGGNQIEHYPVVETIEKLEALVLAKYNKAKEAARNSGKSLTQVERDAVGEAMRLPQCQALKAWQDADAELKLKRAFNNMFLSLKIPALLIRSVSLKAISALKDLGLELPEDAEIDLVVAFVSGDFLHLVVCEVKRADAYPWQTECALPNKQAVNKAENQLSKDVDVLMAILAGTPPNQLVFQTLACFPDSSSVQLQTICCSSCLETGIVFQEDLADLSLLQKKTQVPDKPELATTEGKQLLLTLSTRCLSSAQ